MKLVLILPFLFLSVCMAETSCLKLNPPNSKELLMCDHFDQDNSYFYGSQRLKSCFYGDASEVVFKINDGEFRNVEEGLAYASVINDNTISFKYFSLFGTEFDHIVERCEN